MQSTFTSTNLHQNNQQTLPATYTHTQPSVASRAGPVLPLQADQYVPPLQLNRQQGLAFQSVYTPRPLSTKELLLPRGTPFFIQTRRSVSPKYSQDLYLASTATSTHSRKTPQPEPRCSLSEMPMMQFR